MDRGGEVEAAVAPDVDHHAGAGSQNAYATMDVLAELSSEHLLRPQRTGLGKAMLDANFEHRSSYRLHLGKAVCLFD